MDHSSTSLSIEQSLETFREGCIQDAERRTLILREATSCLLKLAQSRSFRVVDLRLRSVDGIPFQAIVSGSETCEQPAAVCFGQAFLFLITGQSCVPAEWARVRLNFGLRREALLLLDDLFCFPSEVKLETVDVCPDGLYAVAGKISARDAGSIRPSLVRSSMRSKKLMVGLAAGLAALVLFAACGPLGASLRASLLSGPIQSAYRTQPTKDERTQRYIKHLERRLETLIQHDQTDKAILQDLRERTAELLKREQNQRAQMAAMHQQQVQQLQQQIQGLKEAKGMTNVLKSHAKSVLGSVEAALKHVKQTLPSGGKIKRMGKDLLQDLSDVLSCECDCAEMQQQFEALKSSKMVLQGDFDACQNELYRKANSNRDDLMQCIEQLDICEWNRRHQH